MNRGCESWLVLGGCGGGVWQWSCVGVGGGGGEGFMEKKEYGTKKNWVQQNNLFLFNHNFLLSKIEEDWVGSLNHHHKKIYKNVPSF